MTKNRGIAAKVQQDIMSRETTSGNQLSQCIIAILDKEYPEGAKEGSEKPKDEKPKKGKNGK